MLRPLLSATALLLLIPSVSFACIESYPPSIVNIFNKNCVKDDNSKSGYCSCVIEHIQKTIPLGEFIEIGNASGSSIDDARFNKATKACLAKLSGEENSTKPKKSTPAPKITPAKTSDLQAPTPQSAPVQAPIAVQPAAAASVPANSAQAVVTTPTKELPQIPADKTKALPSLPNNASSTTGLPFLPPAAVNAKPAAPQVNNAATAPAAAAPTAVVPTQTTASPSTQAPANSNIAPALPQK